MLAFLLNCQILGECIECDLSWKKIEKQIVCRELYDVQTLNLYQSICKWLVDSNVTNIRQGLQPTWQRHSKISLLSPKQDIDLQPPVVSSTGMMESTLMVVTTSLVIFKLCFNFNVVLVTLFFYLNILRTVLYITSPDISKCSFLNLNFFM